MEKKQSTMDEKNVKEICTMDEENVKEICTIYDKSENENGISKIYR